MSEHKIQFYDSLPFTVVKDGGVSYIEHVWRYLQEEYKVKKGRYLTTKNDQWSFVPCKKDDPSAVIQGYGSNDCGVYSCLFMDLLMSNVDPLCLRSFEVEVAESGRMLLWKAMQVRKTVFDETRRQIVIPCIKNTTDVSLLTSKIGPLLPTKKVPRRKKNAGETANSPPTSKCGVNQKKRKGAAM